MPRNSSGTMSPAGSPFVPGTTISSAAVNARLADEETELTDSLSRSGKGGMTAPVRGTDGSAAAPSISFTSEPASGLYKAATGDVRVAVGGVDALKFGAGGLSGTVTMTAAGVGPVIQTSATNSQLSLNGNRAAADAGPDVAVNSQVTRTAGPIFGVYNVGNPRLLVDYQGLVTLAVPAAAIQSASVWTAITPAAGYTADQGLAFWKDACGIVRLKGRALSAGTGTGTVFTLPAGYRPAPGAGRVFMVSDGSGSGVLKCSVSATGDVSVAVVVPNGLALYVDQISFLAEQ